jgi:ankyrin repeat protein
MQDGITPLMFAAKQGHLDVVKTLVQNAYIHASINDAENVHLHGDP